MRRRRTGPDSLELLLDTLCNTFGGVLFIAMLVVLLLPKSGQGPRVDAQAPEELEIVADLESSLTVIRTEIEALRSADESQARELAPAATRELENLRRALDTARGRVTAALARRDQLLLDLTRRQLQIQRAETELRTLDDELSQARQELRRRKKTRAAEREQRTRDVRLPVVRPTTKQPLSLILRHGRIYVWHRYSSSGEPIGPNLDEFVVTEETGDALIMKPKPTSGLPITDDPSFPDAVAQRFSRFGPQRFYLQIVARPDSFVVFDRLRRTISKLGYEYAVLPAAEGQPVRDRGGRERGVQ